MSSESTIFAVSTPQGRAALAIIRISGPRATDVIELMTNLKALPKPRYMTRCTLYAPCSETLLDTKASREVLDEIQIVYYRAPKSYTGEDMIELFTHGSVSVVRDVLTALGSLSGFMPAQPGEFTQRALRNGKMDLTAVEGIHDLIVAETSLQRQLALRALQGETGHLYSTWSATITRCLAHVEALIDFGEDEMIDPQHIQHIVDEIRALHSSIETYLVHGYKGELIRDGIRVVLVGRPNAGKSSLLNRLAQRDIAIVSPIKGTTRDVLETRVDIGGHVVIMSDTAGLNPATTDPIEIEGIRRARKVIEDAHFLLALLDIEPEQASLLSERLKEPHLFFSLLWPHHEETFKTVLARPDRSILVINKVDLLNLHVTSLPSQSCPQQFAPPQCPELPVCFVSCHTGYGLDELIRTLEHQIAKLFEGTPHLDGTLLARARHRIHLSQCVRWLSRFLETHHVRQVELAAEDLRQAVKCLGRITGHVDVEDILDVIFKDFCIGK